MPNHWERYFGIRFPGLINKSIEFYRSVLLCITQKCEYYIYFSHFGFDLDENTYIIEFCVFCMLELL